MKLSDYKEEIKDKVNIEKETLEAKLAGETALHSLYKAKDHLDNARTWGIFDIFGGGLVSSLVKHSNMNSADSYIKDAKNKLEVFARELEDVDKVCNINIDTGDFLGFADIFFDNMFSDFMMQDRINNARAQIDEAIYRVEDILARL